MNRSITLSATTKWILTILILGVGVVLVVVLYAQQQTRNNQLKSDINTADTILISNGAQKTTLQNRLLQANLDLTEVLTQFPSSTQSMDVEEALYAVAADAGVEMTSINCPAPVETDVQGTKYQVFSITVSLTGQTDNLLRFVGVLGSRLPSASVESLLLGAGDQESTLSLVMKVYALGK
jgi:hypothetical protein